MAKRKFMWITSLGSILILGGVAAIGFYFKIFDKIKNTKKTETETPKENIIKLEKIEAQKKYQNFVDHLWNNNNNNPKLIDLNKLKNSFNAILPSIKIDYNHDMVVRIVNDNNKKIIQLVLGNKSNQLNNIIENLKNMTSKPSYSQFIKSLELKDKTNESKQQINFRNIMDYGLGEKYLLSLSPTPMDQLTNIANDNLLDNESLTKLNSQEKFNTFLKEMKKNVKDDFKKLTVDIIAKTVKDVFSKQSTLSISKHAIDKNIEGTISINGQMNIVKKYANNGLISSNNGVKYHNVLGDKYNHLSNWISNIKTNLASDWNSKNEITFKDFVNSFMFKKNPIDKNSKALFVKIWKIALEEEKPTQRQGAKFEAKLANSNTIDEDIYGNVIKDNDLDGKIAGLSYSPIIKNHEILKFQKDQPKISFWNVLNYSKNDKKDPKTKFLAETIVDTQSSIIGLGEILKQRSLEALTQRLNEIDSANEWKFIRSSLSGFAKNNSRVSSASNASEYYGFVYKSTEFTIKPFEINDGIQTWKTYGQIYENPLLKNEFIDNETTAYVRPPFGTQFINKSGKDFTLVISHNDSPGYTAKSTKGSSREVKVSGFSSQGSQELWEALHTVDVMKYFNSIDGDNGDLVFMGDTNIGYDKKANTSKNIFSPIINSQYKGLINPLLPKSKTSIGFTDYVNPYDRIFVKSTLLTKIDNLDNYVIKYDLIKKWKETQEIKKVLDLKSITEYQKETKYFENDFFTPKFIRTKVSDHAPVLFQWDLTQTEKDSQEEAIDWNQYLSMRNKNIIPL